MVTDSFGEPVTEQRWAAVDLAVRDFIRRYPLHWNVFRKDLHENRRRFNDAFEGDLKEASWRNTASFPVVYRRMTPQERAADPNADDDLVEVESLYETLKDLLPGLTEADKPGAPNRLYKEFLRRFPIFLPSEKL